MHPDIVPNLFSVRSWREKEVVVKILVINHEFPPLGGGGGRITWRLARELSKDHAVDVLTSGAKGVTLWSCGDARLVPVRAWGRQEDGTATLLSWLSFLLGGLGRGYGLCRHHKYDVVHAHFALPSGLLAFCFHHLLGIPYVLTIMGADIYDPTRRTSPYQNTILRSLVRKIINCSSATTAISRDIMRKAVQYYHPLSSSIQVIHPGFDHLEPPFATRGQLDLPDGAFILISIGRLVKRKGLVCVLEAMHQVADRSVLWLVVGDGPERSSLVEAAGHLGLAEQVRFLGHLGLENEKYEYLGASDVFVLPSLHEGFGLVFLEAMACGLPVVTTDKGGQTDIVVDGVNGFIVPVGDSHQLADRIKLLRSNPDLRRRMSRANLKRVLNFSARQEANSYEAILARARTLPDRRMGSS